MEAIKAQPPKFYGTRPNVRCWKGKFEDSKRVGSFFPGHSAAERIPIKSSEDEESINAGHDPRQVGQARDADFSLKHTNENAVNVSVCNMDEDSFSMWEAIVTHFIKGTLCDISNPYLTLTTSNIKIDQTPVHRW